MDKKFINNYKSRIKYRKRAFQHAKRTSSKEMRTYFKKFHEALGPRHLLMLSKDFIGCGAWVGESYFRYLFSHLSFFQKGKEDIDDPVNKYIVQRVAEGKKIYKCDISPSDIFKGIYLDLAYAQQDQKYESKLKCPKINATIVLVSGFWNELFSTAAFERGTEHLSKKHGIKYFSPNVHGFKSVKHNVKLLEEQLTEYIEKYPDEKLWLIAYSKGGIDCLHFIRKNREFAQKYVVGLSTMAAPILGTNHVENKLYKLANKIHHLSNAKWYKKFSKKHDILVREFQRFLSVSYQKPWFKRNYKELPTNLFYTALAFEAEKRNIHLLTIMLRAFFRSDSANDGLIEVENALFPDYFDALNLGVVKGHHWVGSTSSSFSQEALIEAHVIFLKYMKVIS